MRFYWFAIPFALLAVPSFAQQPAPPTMVQQLMANDANIKATLASELDKANTQIATLKAENEALKKAGAAKKEFGKPVPDAEKAK